MTAPALSVLMVTHNRREDVRRCLRSVFLELPDEESEVLVLDNGSTDGTPGIIEAEFPSVTSISWKENRGLAPALRTLVDVSRGEWLLLLDSDTVLRPGCVGDMLSFARSNHRLGAVAPRLRDVSGRIQMTARNFPGPINALFGRQTILSRLFPGNFVTRRFLKAAEQEDGRPFECDWVAFAAVLVRRTALEEAGSIDPRFFVYWVDADFFYRLRKAGWTVWCLPTAEVLHVEHNRTDRVRNPIAIKDFHRGALRYYFKSHGLGGWNPLLWLAAFGLCSRAGLHLLTNKWRQVRS